MINLKEVAQWRNDFEHALSLNTSGSQGFALTKLLYEKMSQFENLEEFKTLEASAGAMCTLGSTVLPEAFLKPVRLTYDLLIQRIYIEANFEDAERRERAWYDKPDTGASP